MSFEGKIDLSGIKVVIFDFDGIKIIQRINSCNLDEILFIEDMDTTIEYLRSNGIRVVDVNAMNTEAV